MDAGLACCAAGAQAMLYALAIGIAVAALDLRTHGESWGSGYDQARHP